MTEHRLIERLIALMKQEHDRTMLTWMAVAFLAFVLVLVFVEP